MRLDRAGLIVATLALTLAACAQEGVIWLEAEGFTAAEGEVLLLDASAPDYGPMARTQASAQAFVRFGPTTRLTLPAVTTKEAGPWQVWVRAFPIAGRAVAVEVDGAQVGATAPEGSTAALVWTRLGAVELAAGQHTVVVRGVEGNNAWPYVDVVALLRDPTAIPFGATPADMISGEPVAAIREDFGAATVEELAERWAIAPPPGADAVVEMAPDEDDGALHVHNGAAETWSLTARVPLAVEPGQQLALRVRMRKTTLSEYVTVVIPQIGVFAPQLYRQWRANEIAWIVPPGVTGPLQVQVIGRGGGDTYLSALEVYRPDPPLDAFATGRFLPAPNPYREGRMFQLEGCVVNAEAFGEQDVDGDGRWTYCRLSRDENVPWFAMGTVLKSDTVAADRATPEDGCPPLHLRIGPLLPGKYQAFLSVPGRAIGYSPDGREWQRLPGTTASDLGVVTITDGWFECWLDDRYAEPGNPGPTYADFIRFMPIEDPAYTMQPIPPMPTLERGSVDSRDVPLTIANESAAERRAEPVRSGVPIPRGELADAEHAQLLDAQGRPVPCHAQVTGRWPDGSVKWLLLDFAADVPARSEARFTLRYGNAVARVDLPPPAALTVTREGDLLRVDTGAMVADIDAAHGGALTLTHPGETAPALSLADGEMADTSGRTWRTSAEGAATVEVEEQTPFRVVVRVRGRLLDAEGSGPLVFDHRLHFFAGRREALVEWGFIATEAEETVPIRRARLRITGPWADAFAVFGLAEGATAPLSIGGEPRLLQTGADAYGNDGPFPFTLAQQGQEIETGERAQGWMRVGGGPLVCVERFWEQFPKALAAAPGEISVDLWPDDPGVPPFIAHAGAGKSHRVGLSLDAAMPPERFTHTLFAAAEPEWHCASGAFEELAPRREGAYKNYEAVVDAAYEQMHSVRAGYGMEDWGDVWQPGYVAGAMTWSNQEWDLVNNWLVPFARTGDRRFLDYAHEAARHFSDVDTVHYAANPDRVGATWIHAHTSLVGHQLEPMNFGHAGWIEGLYNIYHLTGDRRGLETARGIADWVCRHAPPTESHPERGPAYSMAIQRSVGWPLTTLCLAYRETGEPVYLQTARRLFDWAHRYQDPERGVWEAETGHERPFRGGCVFAYTLQRGMRLFAELTGEPEPLEDYARAARWMLCEMWRPGHGYLYEQVPMYDAGTRVPFIVSEMYGYATRLTGDPMYATVARYALEEHAADGAGSWMVDRGGTAQWGNGILQQVPRMLADWEATGLHLDGSVTISPTPPRVRVPIAAPEVVSFVMRNEGPEPLTDLRAQCLIRGDWSAEVLSCPETLAPGAEGMVTIRCQAPPRLAQYELQSDRAHLHALVRYRDARGEGVCWNALRLDIAAPLEVTGPESAALRAGQAITLRLSATNAIDERPEFAAEAASDLPGVTVGAVQVTPTGERTAAIEVPVAAAADAPVGSGGVTVTVRSGTRTQTAEVAAEVGRVRVLLIESGPAEQWRLPFAALRTYPGIAPDFIAAEEVAELLPGNSAEIAARWDVIALGDTGVGAAAFAPGQLQALADFVRAGGGLLAIAGAQCFTPGGYADTPLADVLPVDLTDGAYEMGEIGVEVIEPSVRLFEGYEPTIPPFGAHQRLSAKPDATVLARFADGSPFIALGEAGAGRVMVLGGIWNHGSGRRFASWDRYGTLIGRSVRWLGRDLELR